MSRILLVEDDPNILLVFEESLLDVGYIVEKAKTLQAADAFLQSACYNLIIVDILLPDGNGVVLADKAAAQGVPALIVTGYLLGLTQVYPAIDFTRYPVLQKPLTPGDLLEAVARLLEPVTR